MVATAPEQLGLFKAVGASRPRELAARTGGAGGGVELTVHPKQAGGAGTAISAGYIDDDDQNVDLHNEKWYGEPGTIGIARKMERDPHVAQSLAIKRCPLAAALWDIEAASKSELDLEAADYARFVLFERNNFDHLVKIGTRDMRDGFSLVEETSATEAISTERFPLHPGRGLGVVTTGFHHIPAWTLHRWGQSKTDPSTISEIVQWIIGSDGEKAGMRSISASHLLRWTRDQEGANFAGFSYLRRAYGSWKIKLTLLILQAIRHERYGVDVPIITMPEGASEADFDTAELILLEMRAHQKGYMSLPFGHKFEWAGGTSGSTNIAETIEMCNRDIAFNMGGGFMLLGLSGKGGGGSYALAQSQQGQYEIQLEGDAKFFASVLNFGTDGWCYMRRLIQSNYGPAAGVPKLIARNMPTKDWSKILPLVHNLIASKGIIPDAPLQEFIRQVLTLPPPDPSTAIAAGDVKPVQQETNPPTQGDEETEQ